MKIKTNEICTYSILGALLFSLKFVMSLLPNIEPVSFLLIVYTIVFGLRAIYPLIIYVSLEILIYGFSFWSIGYIYIWLILVFITHIMFNITNSTKTFLWATVSGIYGLLFGALYIPLYLFVGGTTFALTWWLNGIMYDIIHGVANFILCTIAFKPITNILFRLKKIYFS